MKNMRIIYLLWWISPRIPILIKIRASPKESHESTLDRGVGLIEYQIYSQCEC